jgi:hypothetical protein
VSGEVNRGEIKRGRLFAHESEREAEWPRWLRCRAYCSGLGWHQPDTQGGKKPSEPDDEHGGLPLRLLHDPYPRIPELYYG